MLLVSPFTPIVYLLTLDSVSPNVVKTLLNNGTNTPLVLSGHGMPYNNTRVYTLTGCNGPISPLSVNNTKIIFNAPLCAPGNRSISLNINNASAQVQYLYV